MPIYLHCCFQMSDIDKQCLETKPTEQTKTDQDAESVTRFKSNQLLQVGLVVNFCVGKRLPFPIP